MKSNIVKSINELPSRLLSVKKRLLKKNLELLKRVQDEADVNILLALKGFALWSTFDLCQEYLKGCCASGLHEALLAKMSLKGSSYIFARF